MCRHVWEHNIFQFVSFFCVFFSISTQINRDNSEFSTMQKRHNVYSIYGSQTMTLTSANEVMSLRIKSVISFELSGRTAIISATSTTTYDVAGCLVVAIERICTEWLVRTTVHSSNMHKQIVSACEVRNWYALVATPVNLIIRFKHLKNKFSTVKQSKNYTRISFDEQWG